MLRLKLLTAQHSVIALCTHTYTHIFCNKVRVASLALHFILLWSLCCIFGWWEIETRTTAALPAVVVAHASFTQLAAGPAEERCACRNLKRVKMLYWCYCVLHSLWKNKFPPAGKTAVVLVSSFTIHKHTAEFLAKWSARPYQYRTINVMCVLLSFKFAHYSNTSVHRVCTCEHALAHEPVIIFLLSLFSTHLC